MTDRERQLRDARRVLIARTKARHFRIWRYGTMHRWNVTAEELADHVGLKPDTVRKLCLRNGWPLRTERREDQPVPVDLYLRSNA
jgi:hypothetical protein